MRVMETLERLAKKIQNKMKGLQVFKESGISVWGQNRNAEANII